MQVSPIEFEFRTSISSKSKVIILAMASSKRLEDSINIMLK